MTERVRKTRKVYNEIAEDYAAKKAGLYSEKELLKFTGLLLPDSRILSAGCGSGRDAAYFDHKGFRSVGLDISENLLTIGTEQHPNIPFILGDMRSAPFGNESFDGVWAHESLHHLERDDMLPALGELNRVLRPGGVLFILTRKGVGDVTIKEAMSSEQEREYTLLLPDELDGMLTHSGFEKIELDTFNEKDRRENGRDLEWINAFYKKR